MSHEPPRIPPPQSRIFASNLWVLEEPVRASSPRIADACEKAWRAVAEGTLAPRSDAVVRWMNDLELGLGMPLCMQGSEPYADPAILEDAANAVRRVFRELARDPNAVGNWAVTRQLVRKGLDAQGRATWVPALDVVVSVRDVALSALVAYAMLRPADFGAVEAQAPSSSRPPVSASGFYAAKPAGVEAPRSEPSIPLVRRRTSG